jgi:hypothetical protein
LAKKDLQDLIRIWNVVVEDGVAFPQEEAMLWIQMKEAIILVSS